MPRFTLFKDGRLLRSFSIDRDEIRIGRLPELEVVLDSPTVSRQHARIHRQGEEYELLDEASVNGVFVGDRRITVHTLVPGDSIRIENYTVVFEPPESLYHEAADSSGKPSAFKAELPTDPGPEETPANPNMTFLNIKRFIPKE